MDAKLTNQSTTIRNRMLISATTVSLLSLLLMSGCGNEGGDKTAVNQPSISSSIESQKSEPLLGFFEEALPGVPLLSTDSSNSSFKIMAQNLSGLGTVSLIEQKSYDYTVVLNPGRGVAPTLSRQESRTLNPIALTLKAKGRTDSSFGRVSITLDGSTSEPERTFLYQHQINISGIILSSTDQVAIFKAIDPVPYSVDFLKISYTTKNPIIRRFKISQLKPFPISPNGSLITRNSERTSWINVISQKLRTVFQYATK